MPETTTPTKTEYFCPECASTKVQLDFPVWVLANDIDARDEWELDEGAQPQKDSTKGWCLKCEQHILVGQREVPLIPEAAT
jgi:hypothetical protein